MIFPVEAEHFRACFLDGVLRESHGVVSMSSWELLSSEESVFLGINEHALPPI